MTWLNRIKQNFQLYSNADPDRPEGQVLLKVLFVIKSWPDIKQKLEKMEDWQEKSINELLREALKVYLRREEEKGRTRARVMVAVARESVGISRDRSSESPKRDQSSVKPKGVEDPHSDRYCYYCGGKGHI